MHINIVEPYHSVAMRRFVEPLLQFAPKQFNITESEECDYTADVNFWVPGHNVVPDTKNVMLYTHTNPGFETIIQESARNSKHAIAMSLYGRDELRNMGVRIPITTVYPPLGDGFAPRKIKVGIVGSEQPNGRKRSHLLLDLAWQMDLTLFQFVIIGNGWEETINKLQNLGVTIEHCDKLSDEQLQVFYRNIDILLVTGYTEGGPLPVIEALASGIPVLSPRYGLAADYLSAYYSDAKDLSQQLMKATKGINDRIGKVGYLSDYRYAMETLYLLASVADPDIIVSRYDNVVKYVRQHNIQSILEIGTNVGIRALRMIQAAQEKTYSVEYCGIDLFRSLSNEESQKENASYPIPDSSTVYSLLEKTGAKVNLYTGYSHASLDDLVKDSKKFDFIFIDGGHSWETIKGDWDRAQSLIHSQSIVLFDDYYPKNLMGVGCQQVIDGLDKDIWSVQLLDPIEEWMQSWGMLDIQMALVSKNE